MSKAEVKPIAERCTLQVEAVGQDMTRLEVRATRRCLREAADALESQAERIAELEDFKRDVLAKCDAQMAGASSAGYGSTDAEHTLTVRELRALAASKEKP